MPSLLGSGYRVRVMLFRSGLVLGTVIVRVRVKDGHLVNSTVRVLVTLGLWMSAVVVFAGGRCLGQISG